MRKRGIMKPGMCVGVLMCLTFSVPSYAAEVPMVVTGEIQASQITIMTEQTTWVHRVYKGIRQKRLWSLTYNRWKTNWMNY